MDNFYPCFSLFLLFILFSSSLFFLVAKRKYENNTQSRVQKSHIFLLDLPNSSKRMKNLNQKIKKPPGSVNFSCPFLNDSII